jgi:hypothetical protein
MKRSRMGEPMPWSELWEMTVRVVRLHLAVKAFVWSRRLYRFAERVRRESPPLEPPERAPLCEGGGRPL